MKAFDCSVVALLASAVLAQTDILTAASSTSTCAADYIVEQCLTDTSGKQEACDTHDYSCLCDAYQAEYTCFNNCPGDPRQGTYEGLVQQHCALASQYASTNRVVATASVTATKSIATATVTTADTSTATGAADSTGASASSTANSAADLALNAGGLLAAVAGVMGALL